MVQRFYLDESGHGGDVIGKGDFKEQPIFALACVGVGDDALLRAALEQIRGEFGIAPGELKSKDLKGRLAPVAQALARFLGEQGWPVFIEVVDKRFFLAIHIVERLLCTQLNGGYVDQDSKNMMAEFLCDRDAAPVFAAYLTACRTPEIEAVREAVDALWDWLETRDEEIARTTQVLTMFARDKAKRADADPLNFLPLADTGPTGKPVWMLPNLQCLTNIYARINQWSGRGLNGLELVHDDQLQYEGVLRDAKALMESLASEDAYPWVRFADYQLGGTAGLRFAKSEDEPCIQAADILAGFSMRHIRRSCERPGKTPASERAAFFDLLGLSNPLAATGVNLVMTMRDLRRIEIPTLSSHLTPFRD